MKKESVKIKKYYIVYLPHLQQHLPWQVLKALKQYHLQFIIFNSPQVVSRNS